MDIFRKFAIRKAEVIAAKLKGVEVNPHARQASISIRAEDDPRSELRMILGRAELEDLHRRIGVALGELPAN
ncbi:hypothetical protein BVH03_17985 [Pseudomonas sp. PA15(2017)]|uniref:hypothetical protein n=1 Tax=Pseudomonas sp. PA15(2017) TaxID=1932111 RepID=UPI00096514BA|nr:hypothetical protein [Pseudomonas sp. PA15(2017)]OLU25534.1 hypothetical protein BVH03_17985 [Pseudomonas sp. PA15(2017)]